MGVGFSVDLVVCVALGIDMFDCVFPTRTAVGFLYLTKNKRLLFIYFFFQRFGCALVRTGQLNLKQSKYAKDFRPIDAECKCTTCIRYTRAYIHGIVTSHSVACHLLTVHNVAHHLRMMGDIRESIKKDQFPEFVREFMLGVYPDKDYPKWILDALGAVHIQLVK